MPSSALLGKSVSREEVPSFNSRHRLGFVLFRTMMFEAIGIENSGMAQTAIYRELSASISLQAQQGDTFLSSKHQDYLAAIAEFISVVRAL